MLDLPCTTYSNVRRKPVMGQPWGGHGVERETQSRDCQRRSLSLWTALYPLSC